MSELNVKPILRQFLLSITGNDIMQTNNDNYDCIDRFIESDRFQVALKQANVVATGGGQLTIPDVMPRFEIDYTFTDRTDASIHKEVIQAENADEALNELCLKYDYKIEWRTIKKLNGA